MTRAGAHRGSHRRSTPRPITTLCSSSKIPVYITYFTMRVNDDGTLATFRDLYGHDSRMLSALNGNNYFGDAVAQDNSGAAPWSGQDSAQWNGRDQGNARRARRGRDSVDNFARSLFGF